jgi:hypothetical protein
VADERFKVVGRAGSATGCGRLLILFGEPDDVQEEASGAPFGSAQPRSWQESGVERSSASQMEKFPDTGMSNLTVSFSLLKGTTVIAQAGNQAFDEAHVVSSVGPEVLDFEPGPYVPRLRVKDNLSRKKATVDQAFVIQ